MLISFGVSRALSDLSYSLLSRIKLLTWKESRYYMISKSYGLFHIVSRTRTYNSNIEGYWMLDKSKSSVQDTKSTRNRTSVFTTEFTNRNSVRIPSLFTHIELKVPSGSVLTTRASPVFKSNTSNWRFSQATFPNRTEWVFISRANPVFKSKHKSNLFAVELNECIHQSN